MLLPQDSLFLTVIVDSKSGLYVRTLHAQDTLYVIQADWNVLAELFPADSILYVIVFENLDGKVCMGVYDIVRDNGVDLCGEDVLQRHVRVQAHIRSNPASAIVTAHWVGFEEACKHLILQQNDHIPFKVKYTLRIEETCYTPILFVRTA